MTLYIDKDAVETWQWDWTTNGLATGETISSATVTGTNLTVGSPDYTTTAGVVAVVVSAATGVAASATCHVVTSEGNEYDDTITRLVAET